MEQYAQAKNPKTGYYTLADLHRGKIVDRSKIPFRGATDRTKRDGHEETKA